MGEWKTKTASNDTQMREALELAHKVLSEIAQTRGLDPTGERARDLCAEALQNNGKRHSRGY